MDFHEFFKKYWDDLTFWEKVQYRLISIREDIVVYFQIYTHKWFGIDWTDPWKDYYWHGESIFSNDDSELAKIDKEMK